MSPHRTEAADVVVCGCGPGGAVLSYLLARSGIDVALVERAADFQREFRGFGYSPGVVELFDQMGLLERVLALEHETVRKGEVVLYGRTVELFDFSVLDTDHPYALLMEQPALLELFVDAASAYDGFSFASATTVTDLLTEGNCVVGVRAHDRKRDAVIEIRGALVVGADGRYSTTRSAAGIDPGLYRSPLELVWFKLPSSAVGGTTQVQGRLEREGLLVYFGLGGGELQVGWFIEKGTYPELRRTGIEAFRGRIAAVDPRLRAALDAHLTGFDRCSLLAIAPGIADEWVRDGLLLIGDAAHVASPIGAQGNALAIQDAAAAHPVIVEALADGPDAVPASRLISFQARRRPAVEEVTAQQRRAERVLSLFVAHGEKVPPTLVRGVAEGGARLLATSKLARKGIERFAFGPDRVTVERTRFVD